MNFSIKEPAHYFLREESYNGSHAYFYNSQDFPEIIELESKWNLIRNEIAPLINGEKQIDVTNINPPYLSSPDAWKNIYFYNFGWKKHKNCAQFPLTHSIIRSIPNLIFAGITVMEPYSRVLPHNGETNTTIRCHLGLHIPAQYPICGVRVGNEEHGWENGKVLMFSDAHYHSTWNESSERRFVMVFDILRKEYAGNAHLVKSKILGALSLKYFYSKKPALKKTPLLFIKTFHLLFSCFWFFYIPLQNRFKILP